MKAMTGCALFGVSKVLSGIRDAYILQHSVVGCNSGMINFRNIHKTYSVRQASTVVYDREVIYGGTKLLEKGIKAVDKRFPDVSTIFVVSGCVPNMIGDDVETVLTSLEIEKNLIHIQAPGYQGNIDSGIEIAFLKLGDLVKYTERTQIPSVNIIGLTSEDPYAEEDIRELKRIFGDKVTINCHFVDTTIDNIAQMSAAHLNIVFGCGGKLAKKLQKEFGTPYIETAYPIGIQGMIGFLRKVEKVIDVDFSSECEEIYALGQSIVRKTSYYLSTLYQQSAGVVGDKLHLQGIRNFIQDELGMNIPICINVADGDERKLEEEINNENIAVLFGNGLQRTLAEKLEIPFVAYCYPLHDQVCLTSGLLGVQGTAYLLEMLINSVLQQKYKTKGIYRELLEVDGGQE